jgi:hypothetical protein
MAKGYIEHSELSSIVSLSLSFVFFACDYEHHLAEVKVIKPVRKIARSQRIRTVTSKHLRAFDRDTLPA